MGHDRAAHTRRSLHPHPGHRTATRRASLIFDRGARILRPTGYDAAMRLPAALVPLRNSTFRTLWLANVVAWLGTWLQNTGAGWLMTTLAPHPFIVAMVQAATIMPVFLL